jgi:hypothetical protein
MSIKLSTSVISSFDVGHFGNSIKNWHWQDKVDCKHVEVYAFMHNCLEIIFPDSHESTALLTLARAYENPLEVQRVADLIHEHFKGLSVSAVASFLPEILAPQHSPLWQMAQKALSFLVLVVAKLRDDYKHQCTTLVMAGGGCFDGMWEGRSRNDDNDRIIVVNRLPREKAIRRLLDRLETVAEVASVNNVRLAISMEPGPLYAIGDWNSVLALCRAIESRSSHIKSCVGLNLDIAHWAFLSNITVQMVQGELLVQKRIIHAHISDHDRGHCSDAKPGTFHAPAVFEPWINLLKKLPQKYTPTNKSGLLFSGFVSCEHEAACHFGTVSESINEINKWLEKTNTTV